MEKFKNYEFLLFDADRTLFDFDASEKAAFYEVAPKYGITPDEKVHKLYCRLNNENWEALERGEFTRRKALTATISPLWQIKVLCLKKASLFFANLKNAVKRFIW